MAGPIPEPFTLHNAAIKLAIYRWGDAHVGRPAVLLTHGTGFCGPVWQAVAEALAREFVVYAIDRRGHGASSKPADAYHFADFAQDTVRIIDELQLEAAYAIGHSAGATDLLLAAALRPQAFRCIFAMEPTAMDTSAPGPRAEAHDQRMARAARRRATFESFDAVFEHYRSRPVFRAWQPELLQAYVRHGFESQPDGTVSLRCTPDIELAMLTHIASVMNGSYTGDSRGNPFETFDRISCPIRIATTEGSQPIFKQMAAAAKQRIAHASAHHFDGVGHNVAQMRPDVVVSAARAFWAENTADAQGL
jgi:pimeloyl-ACP methyl ester carboxylesterase